MPIAGEHLNVQLLARLLEIPYDTLRRYVAANGVSDLMGGTKVKGELGVRFPAESLDRWHQLAALHNAGAISPRTASAALRLLWQPSSEASIVAPGGDEFTVASHLKCIVAALHRIDRTLERKKRKKRRK